MARLLYIIIIIISISVIIIHIETQNGGFYKTFLLDYNSDDNASEII